MHALILLVLLAAPFVALIMAATLIIGRQRRSATVRALLHRTGQPPCARRGLYAESERVGGDQQARHLTWTLTERPKSFRFLIRDRHQKFTAGCDEVFQSTGLEIVRTPFRAPQANGVAERFVRTVRSECLDWLLILNDQHLGRVLDVFVAHYNGHRPHRALALTPPRPTRPPTALAWAEARVQRRDRLGGVVHEYVLAA